jgi:hypothetical protein
VSTLTILTRPRQSTLTTLATVRGDLGLEEDTDAVSLAAENALLARYIRQASASIARYCNRTWGRAQYRQTWQGQGAPPLALASWLMLDHTPVLAIDASLVHGEPFTDYELDAGAGLLSLTQPLSPWSPTWGASIQIDYTAGYLLPSDTLTSNAISAQASDNSLNHSAAGFPLLVPGDVLTVAGFLAENNNGTATVVSRTASTLVIEGLTLVDAAAAQDITLTLSTLPDDVEGACVCTVRSLYLQRQWQLTGPRVIQAEGGTQFLSVPSGALPKEARELLRPYQRIV